MTAKATILVTGAAGFIGSYLVGYLNRLGYAQIIIADEFGTEEKKQNYLGKDILQKIEREELFSWLDQEEAVIDFVFHLGARTDTTEFDYAIHQRLNVDYSKKIWEYCTRHTIPLLYASSAATYGSGSKGYKDDHAIVNELEPLNPYGISKNEFDKWALQQSSTPPFWAGLKFFNVYGPNEYHKGRMASVIFHSFNQLQQSGTTKLFRSHKEGYRDGEQLRDFIYVDDIAAVCYWLMQNQPASGLYNLGTGQARTFNDLVTAVFNSLELPVDIQYISMPEDIRDKYQYFTEADMAKLSNAGYTKDFYSLEDGVREYVREYLLRREYY